MCLDGLFQGAGDIGAAAINSGAQQAIANDASQSAANLWGAQEQTQLNYINSTENALRDAIAGVARQGNPFAEAAAGMPGPARQGAGSFGGGSSSGGFFNGGAFGGGTVGSGTPLNPTGYIPAGQPAQAPPEARITTTPPPSALAGGGGLIPGLVPRTPLPPPNIAVPNPSPGAPSDTPFPGAGPLPGGVSPPPIRNPLPGQRALE